MTQIQWAGTHQIFDLKTLLSFYTLAEIEALITDCNFNLLPSAAADLKFF
jgi:hypothetical protein